MPLSYRPPEERLEGGALLLVAPVLAWLTLWIPLLGWHVDDAGISYAYARNLADGLGFRAVQGGPLAEGFSNPAWTLLLTGAVWLGVGVLAASKILQAALGAATLLGLHALVRAAGGRRDEATGAALVTALSAPWVVWSAGGLETVWLSACLVGFLWVVASERAGWLAGAFAAGVALARPEGPLLAAALLVTAEGLAPDGGWRKRRVMAWAIPVLACVAWLGVRVFVFESLVPTAWWVKAARVDVVPRLVRGALYVGLFAAEIALPLLALGWGAASGIRRLQRLARAAALIVALQVAIVVFVGGDWMRHGRLLAPFVPLIAAASAPGLIALLYSPHDVGRRVLDGRARHLGWAFLAAYVGVELLFWQAAVRRPPLPMAITADSADLLAELGPAWCGETRPHFATPDVGAALVRHPEARVIDLVGLLDAVDARHGGPGWWSARLADLEPQAVLVHGPWVPRTGLYPDVLAAAGYVEVCRRKDTPGPHEARYPPTLYRRSDCTRPLSDAQTARLDDWCARPR